MDRIATEKQQAVLLRNGYTVDQLKTMTIAEASKIINYLFAQQADSRPSWWDSKEADEIFGCGSYDGNGD